MNICQACGACCTSFCVSFPRDEIDTQAGGYVPALMTEDYGNVACMRTTASAACIARRGTPGKRVNCAIYARRPGACRDFAPLALLGEYREECRDARRRLGLAELPG